MRLEIYYIPVALFAGIGLLAAILLIIASKLFAVKTDERISEIEEILPHANCGACGYAGCADYAAAVVNGGAATNLCKPGGTETAEKVAAVMGTKAEAVRPEVMVLRCRGNCNAAVRKYEYDGIQSCAAAQHFFGGSNACAYGCIGLGDCVKVCDQNAIRIVNGIADIQPGLCVACGKCAQVCPNQLLALRGTDKHYDVRCSSHDNGKTTKLICNNGCIGCKICERKCLRHAITVTNFLAVIDYNKCENCGVCRENCPTGAIVCCEDTN